MALSVYNRRSNIIFRYCRLFIFVIGVFSFAVGCIIIKRYKSAAIIKTDNILPTMPIVKGVHQLQKNYILSAKEAYYSNSELHMKLLKQKMDRLAKKVKKSRPILLNSKLTIKPSLDVHIFYYAWYGNKKIDGNYKHWNHKYLPNWKKNDQIVYPTAFHIPELDIGSNFYPTLGCYSSQDGKVIDIHMRQLKESGIGVAVISWTPPNFTDSPTNLLPLLFRFAHMHNIKIALHIEPYVNRNPINLFEHLKIFLADYRNHPALYKMKKPLGEKEVPLFYVYDSYLTPAVAWKELLSSKGNLSIRGTNVDAIFIGLLVEMQHRYHIKKSHFDGFYTYFAANGFSYGSTWKNWRSLSKFAVQTGLIFIPSVGPGYIDTQVRPWNSRTTRHRRHGQYYDVAWRTAINSHADYISITSFNEWHEGTQIEPAMPKNVPGFTYLNYEPDGSYFYINLTRWWVEQFNKALSKQM